MPPAPGTPPPAPPRTPLLLLCGQLCTARLWRAQIEGLADLADIAVHCPAQDGDVESAAARILAQAPPRFALAAHAMGGFVALAIMRQAPARVTRLALLGTNAAPDAPEQRERRLRYRQMTLDGRLEELIAQRYELVLHPALASLADFREIVAQMARETGADAFLHQQDIVLGRPDSRPRLVEIGCPCLLVVGRQDRLATVEQHAEIAALVPRARLQVIEDCGHFSLLEHPAETTRLLRGWLLEGDAIDSPDFVK